MEESQFDKRDDVIPRPSGRPFLTQRLPFIAVLALAVVGVAYMNVSNQALIGYWEFLALATGFLCVATEWDKAEDKAARYRLIWTQALHWVAILVTMNMVLYSNIQQMMPAAATSLILLALLALGTFLAGVSLISLEICFLGLSMAAAVPAIAWLKQSALFLVLGAVFLVGVVLALRPRGAARQNGR
ncbi:hypothetical protein [Blastochloris tepida]|uniref:Uncharacterized protein n=1 Tax=Blastochloris tepida TaxID=2233851 RepID=A0A348FXY3_9HYPH|nr:hypothetical protein [Blastochloris tepida]BBF92166.1 hypothetical protein BLTE_08510 [Blastochloris tepida]